MKHMKEAKIENISARIFYKSVREDSVKTVELLKIDNLSGESHEDIGELLFSMFNDDEDNPLGTPEGQKMIRERGAHHTSMSVGDSIVFDDGVVIHVDDVGFSREPTNTFVDDLIYKQMGLTA
jgi:hypothetical protein